MAARRHNTPQKPQKPQKPRSAAERQPGQPWLISELARALRVSDQFLYDKIKPGKLTVLELDGVYRVPDPVAQRLLGREPVADRADARVADTFLGNRERMAAASTTNRNRKERSTRRAVAVA